MLVQRPAVIIRNVSLQRDCEYPPDSLQMRLHTKCSLEIMALGPNFTRARLRVKIVPANRRQRLTWVVVRSFSLTRLECECI